MVTLALTDFWNHFPRTKNRNPSGLISNGNWKKKTDKKERKRKMENDPIARAGEIVGAVVGGAATGGAATAVVAVSAAISDVSRFLQTEAGQELVREGIRDRAAAAKVIKEVGDWFSRLIGRAAREVRNV